MEKGGGVRKGPWTEQEDVQLVLYVNLFGDRRWDFIANVSGLKRSGKSCRLRWVNYLHPDLKRGKMTPHEERLVLDLHNKWGNRWSKIAQKLPGRTDNEIKNYWRTLMRKKAQERKKGISSSSNSSSPSSSSSSASSAKPKDKLTPVTGAKEQVSFYDTGGLNSINPQGQKKNDLDLEKRGEVCTIDDLWKEFEFTEEIKDRTISPTTTDSPIWDQSDTLWSMDEEEIKFSMQPIMESDHFYPLPLSNYYYNI